MLISDNPQNISKAPQSGSPIHVLRQYRMLVFLLSSIGIIALRVFAGVSILAVTSSCGLSSEWNALVSGAPRVPLPDSATILSERPMGAPLESGSGSGYRAFGELYHTQETQATMVAFYQQRGATCASIADSASPYWSCELPTRTGGWSNVDIFEAAPSLVLPRTNRNTDYHLTAPMPSQGRAIAS